MEKVLSLKTLAYNNSIRKPYRTATLLSLIALSSALLFGCLILVSSLKGGIGGIQSRIGADLMVVPKGYEAKMESVLLSGEPNYFYMDRSIEEKIRLLEGVDAVTSQFYLTSLSEGCCDFPIQLVGFEPETDFIVKNWAKSRLAASELLFAGCNVNLERKKVRFFGSTHPVASKLERSGSGMDTAIYVDIETLQGIFEDAKAKGFGFISDGDTKTKTSVIFIRAKSGVSQDGLALKVKSLSDEIQVIQGEKFISSLMNKLSSFALFLYAIAFFVFLVNVLTIAFVFLLSINERLREFSILRVLGCDHAALRSIVFFEAFFLGTCGSLAGIFLSGLLVIPFNIVIAEKIALPFALASVGKILLFALLVFAFSVLSCLLSSAASALRISKFEPYGQIK